MENTNLRKSKSSDEKVVVSVIGPKNTEHNIIKNLTFGSNNSQNSNVDPEKPKDEDLTFWSKAQQKCIPKKISFIVIIGSIPPQTAKEKSILIITPPQKSKCINTKL